MGSSESMFEVLNSILTFWSLIPSFKDMSFSLSMLMMGFLTSRLLMIGDLLLYMSKFLALPKSLIGLVGDLVLLGEG